MTNTNDAAMTYHPFTVHEHPNPSRWLITCDHAANTVPPSVAGGSLGLPDADMARHIAYDVGAAGVTRRLAEALNANAILSNFSRLVIDPNRGADDPTLLMRLYDGSIIPANRDADQTELLRRMALCYDPYHDALADLAARRDDTVIVSVHSFTPQLRGRGHRPWQVGVLYSDEDTRLAQPFIELLKADAEIADAVRLESGEPFCVGDNAPYSGMLKGDAIDRHALAHRRLNVLIEVRNDLIEDRTGQAVWAERLAPVLTRALDLALDAEAASTQV